MLFAATCTPPAIIKSVPPAFPSNVIPDPHGGTLNAGVRVVFSSDGSVSSAEIAQTTGIPAFDASAVNAVKQWKFAPPTPGCTADPANVASVTYAGVPLPPGSYDPCSHDAFILNQVTPDYPDSARHLGLGRATVILLVDLDADGHLENMSLTRSSGNMAFDQAARDAAQASVYAPKQMNCQPVAGAVPFKALFQ